MPVILLFRALLLSLFVITVGCNQSMDPISKPITPVRIQRVENLFDIHAIRYSASIDPYTQVDLAFKVGGYIQKILTKPGANQKPRDIQQNDFIGKNVTLAHIRDVEYQDQVRVAHANLNKAKAALAKARDDMRRAKNLYATQSITQPDYDHARKEFESDRAEVNATLAQLDEAKLNLSYTMLKSPFAGVIIQRNIEIGSLVNVGSVGFVLADVSSVKAVFNVPDLMLKHVKTGQSMEITTESIPATQFTGIITAISPKADSSTRTFGIEITIDNPKNSLLPGMVAALKVSTGVTGDSTTVIPLASIVQSIANPNGFAVYQIEQQDDATIARLKEVELGDEVIGNRILLESGLETGAQIIVTGAQMVADGERVSVIP